jgi:hypothetical protein
MPPTTAPATLAETRGTAWGKRATPWCSRRWPSSSGRILPPKPPRRHSVKPPLRRRLPHPRHPQSLSLRNPSRSPRWGPHRNRRRRRGLRTPGGKLASVTTGSGAFDAVGTELARAANSAWLIACWVAAPYRKNARRLPHSLDAACQRDLLPRAAKAASGACSMSLRSARAGPRGERLPCSNCAQSRPARRCAPQTRPA